MAPSIFLSWSSPDRAAALRLRDRLRAVGLQVWEYTDDMAAGADIHEDIIKTINQVQMAILCFSDATAKSQWILDEAAWSVQTMLAGDRPLRYILPAWVGPHQENLAPPVIAARNLRIVDLFERGEPGLRHFVDDVFKQLGLDAPHLVPAALFAMKRTQYEALLRNGLDAKLTNACEAAGMSAADLAAPAFLHRYGDEPEDFAPFPGAQGLFSSIERTLLAANRTRVATGRRPLFLSWCREQLVGPLRSQMARNEWAARDSLLIVDSVSAFHPEIQADLLQLPQPKRPERAALLWVPPHTHHLAPLEEALAAAAAIVAHLGDAFSDWRECEVPQPLDRPLAFDTSTPAALRFWLRRAFLGIEAQAEPVLDNLRAMQATSANRVSLSELLPQSGRA
jgi:hypothetical protein